MMLEDYEIIDVIPVGKEGIVKKARNRRTGQLCAIKKTKTSQETMHEQRIMTYLANRDYPWSISMLDCFNEGGYTYMVTEVVQSDLQHHIKTRKLSLHEIAKLAFQLLFHLCKLHELGLCHGDINPHNILVFPDGNIKLSNFTSTAKMNSNTTKNNRGKIGTPSYRAPELVLRAKNYNFAADIWSAGVTIAEIFTVGVPFFGNACRDYLDAVCAVIGSPVAEEWPQGFELARAAGYSFPKGGSISNCSRMNDGQKRISLRLKKSVVNSFGVDLIKRLCWWNPKKRIKACDALLDPFFGILTPVQKYAHVLAHMQTKQQELKQEQHKDDMHIAVC